MNIEEQIKEIEGYMYLEYIEGIHRDLLFDTPYKVRLSIEGKKYLTKLLKQQEQEIREEARKEEADRWINQPANEHDNRIREEAVEVTFEKIGDGMVRAYRGCKCCGVTTATVHTEEELDNLKQEEDKQ